jgi:hypothetical protein
VAEVTARSATEAEPTSARLLAAALVRESPHMRRRAMPDFPAFMRSVVDVWSPQPDLGGEVTRLLRDMGRFAAATWAVYLEATPGGLTAARMADTLRRTDTSGPGRAGAIITYLRFINYIEPALERDNRRDKRYRTTEVLRVAFRERMRRELAVRAHLDPAIAWVLGAYETRFLPFFVVVAEVSLLNLSLRLVADPPAQRNPVDLFSERFGGMAILHEMMSSADPGDTFPPRGPLTFTAAHLARRCETSRMQVASVLRATRKAGSILPTLDGRERLSEELVQALEGLVAGTTDMLIGCARILQRGTPTFFDED